MTFVDDMTAELRVITGSATAAYNITRHVVLRCLGDAASLHNTGNRRSDLPDAPPEELAEQVPDEHKAAVGSITFALVAAIRAAGGPACPEVGLPMAYAAEAVLLGLGQHHDALRRAMTAVEVTR